MEKVDAFGNGGFEIGDLVFLAMVQARTHSLLRRAHTLAQATLMPHWIKFFHRD
jgi:hypothetical protein